MALMMLTLMELVSHMDIALVITSGHLHLQLMKLVDIETRFVLAHIEVDPLFEFHLLLEVAIFVTLVPEIDFRMEKFIEITPCGMGLDVGGLAPAVPSTDLHGS